MVTFFWRWRMWWTKSGLGERRVSLDVILLITLTCTLFFCVVNFRVLKVEIVRAVRLW